jgi:hypothetical protein
MEPIIPNIGYKVEPLITFMFRNSFSYYSKMFLIVVINVFGDGKRKKREEKRREDCGCLYVILATLKDDYICISVCVYYFLSFLSDFLQTKCGCL